MVWPTQNDYDEAAENLRYSMSDEDLRGGQAELDDQQLPKVWSGNFANVYRIDCPATGKSWALKCFTREVSTRQERYRHIAAALKAARLPFTVPFVYLEHGVQVHGQWFPAVKMEWVEGQTLNSFVEESLEKPKMLRQLLDLWPRLASRLRDAGIAHADLQHGNVLLVPAADGKLALKLIDYDGMYVPALAGTQSGEMGHAAYQHPKRAAQRAYNAHVDRFSHLVIYTAVHCLKSDRQNLWRQFSNGDNLLFREADFQKPNVSTVFQSLWELGDEQSRAMVGRLILACRQPLEGVPWVDEIVVRERVHALTRKEESQIDEMLAVGKAASAVPDRGTAANTESGLPWAIPVEAAEETTDVLADLAEQIRLSNTRPTQGTVSATPPLDRQFRPVGKLLWGGVADTTRWLDSLFRRLVGKDNDAFRYYLWAALPLLLLGAVWAGVSALTPSPKTPSTKPWKLQPIAARTIEVRNPLTVTAAVENSEAWKGKLHYSLGFPTVLGMSIDAATGIFTWTPTEEAAGKYEVTVLVTDPDGRRDETSFVVNVLRPMPPLKLNRIPAQTVEAGKPFQLAVTLENPDAWQGKVRYAIASLAFRGARIDPQSGRFSWTPPQDQVAGQQKISISATGREGQTTQTSFTITVTRPISVVAVHVLTKRDHMATDTIEEVKR